MSKIGYIAHQTLAVANYKINNLNSNTVFKYDTSLALRTNKYIIFIFLAYPTILKFSNCCCVCTENYYM